MRKTLLRGISILMLLLAVAFILWAVSDPTLGSTVYIGAHHIGANYWWIGYSAYILIMAGLFISSFFIGDPK